MIYEIRNDKDVKNDNIDINSINDKVSHINNTNNKDIYTFMITDNIENNNIARKLILLIC